MIMPLNISCLILRCHRNLYNMHVILGKNLNYMFSHKITTSIYDIIFYRLCFYPPDSCTSRFFVHFLRIFFVSTTYLLWDVSVVTFLYFLPMKTCLNSSENLSYDWFYGCSYKQLILDTVTIFFYDKNWSFHSIWWTNIWWCIQYRFSSNKDS